MDAYESDSDSGGGGGVPQSSILKQISAIQNISHEMSEPTRRSAESSFVSNVSWQQPGVRVTGGGEKKLRPENVRSGTRIAHKIAKASIQELLLARSAMDLEEVRARGRGVWGVMVVGRSSLKYVHSARR